MDPKSDAGTDQYQRAYRGDRVRMDAAPDQGANQRPRQSDEAVFDALGDYVHAGGKLIAGRIGGKVRRLSLRGYLIVWEQIPRPGRPEPRQISLPRRPDGRRGFPRLDAQPQIGPRCQSIEARRAKLKLRRMRRTNRNEERNREPRRIVPCPVPYSDA